MAKVKYRYNPETLSYDVITVTIRERLVRWGCIMGASVLISVIYFVIYSLFYDTPKERTLSNRIGALKFEYQMMLQEFNSIDLILSDIQKRDDNIYRTVLESEPVPASIRQAGFGGVNRYEPLEGFENSSLMISANKHSHRILNQLYIQSLSYDELIEKAIQHEKMTQSRPAIMPIAKKDLRSTNLSKFGWRMHPKFHEMRMHYGMDFGAQSGTFIHATGDGVVVMSEYRGGYGWTVVVDHGIVGYHTLYAHMLRKGAPVGKEVKRGDIIGLVGNTGWSTSPHVHYEVHKNGFGRHVDPIFYFYIDLSDDEYSQFVEHALSSEDIFEDWDTHGEMEIYEDEVEIEIEEVEVEEENN